jgi:hypothetical protein
MLLWQVAFALDRAHRVRDDGSCSCGDPYPCRGARLAARGLVDAWVRSLSMTEAARIPQSRTGDET